MDTPEGIKQKRKNFKPDYRQRGTPQKRKANDSDGKDWTSKFCNAIKTDHGLKSIMSMIATEERTDQASNSQPSVPGNQALVSALPACVIQSYLTALVVRPSAPNAATTAVVPVNPPAQSTISTIAQTFPATNIKL